MVTEFTAFHFPVPFLICELLTVHLQAEEGVLVGRGGQDPAADTRGGGGQDISAGG